MKLVQILRPLFFVALGLHALVLFLPVGEDAAVIEDVALDELPAEKGAPSPPSPVSGALPVPDPNVSTDSPKAKSSATTVATRSAATTTSAATRPAANPRSAATRSTSTARRASSGSGSQRRASSGSSGSTTQSNNASGNASGRNNSSAQNNSSTPNNSANTRQHSNVAANAPANNQSSGGSTIPILPSSNDEDTSESSTGDTSSAAERASALIAQATRDLPKSLLDFATKIDRSLTYNADNTDDASAQQAKDEWQADIQRQANVGQIERMPPAEIAELTQIEYPIESSLQAKGRSLRRCLTEDPRPAEVGVLFDVQGNVVDEPVLLRSTGYSALDEEIQALVAAFDDFPSDRASKAYFFDVDIFYDSELCVTVEDLQK